MKKEKYPTATRKYRSHTSQVNALKESKSKYKRRLDFWKRPKLALLAGGDRLRQAFTDNGLRVHSIFAGIDFVHDAPHFSAAICYNCLLEPFILSTPGTP